MYAIIEAGAKQYRVSKGDILEVERDSRIKEGDKEIKLDKVLLVSDKKELKVGKPYIKGAFVVCQFIGNKRSGKVISFKYRRRRASSRKKIGHRQHYIELKVKEVHSGAH